MKPDTTIYFGSRDPDIEVTVNGHRLDPAASFKIRNHSPTGFNWGYGGSGPAQLALAICLDFLEEPERAQRVYQDFKWKLISALPAEWKISGAVVRKTIEAVEHPREHCEHTLVQLGFTAGWQCTKCKRIGTWVDGLIVWDEDPLARSSEGGSQAVEESGAP